MRRTERVLLFGIGVLLGIVLKNIASQSVTIGYEDYTLQTLDNQVYFNVIEDETLTKNNASVTSKNANVCSENLIIQ